MGPEELESVLRERAMAFVASGGRMRDGLLGVSEADGVWETPDDRPGWRKCCVVGAAVVGRPTRLRGTFRSVYADLADELGLTAEQVRAVADGFDGTGYEGLDGVSASLLEFVEVGRRLRRELLPGMPPGGETSP